MPPARRAIARAPSPTATGHHQKHRVVPAPRFALPGDLEYCFEARLTESCFGCECRQRRPLETMMHLRLRPVKRHILLVEIGNAQSTALRWQFVEHAQNLPCIGDVMQRHGADYDVIALDGQVRLARRHVGHAVRSDLGRTAADQAPALPRFGLAPAAIIRSSSLSVPLAYSAISIRTGFGIVRPLS